MPHYKIELSRRERKVIKMTYNGVTRIVEPYSLAFKRRVDGVAQEYLYVWDRTGGRSNGPGIKSLLHSGVQTIDVLDETFEPRFPIELSKAGESAASGYFSQQRLGRPRTPVRAPRRRAVRTGPVYVIQCNYCGKQFRRTQRTTRLNAHQDRYRNRCPGRTGFIVRYG